MPSLIYIITEILPYAESLLTLWENLRCLRLWSLDPKHSNREATGTDTKPSQERKNTQYTETLRGAGWAAEGTPPLKTLPLIVLVLTDLIFKQIVCWGKEFIHERLLQAKHWVRLTYLILSSLIFCEWMVLLTQIHSSPQLLIIT